MLCLFLLTMLLPRMCNLMEFRGSNPTLPQVVDRDGFSRLTPGHRQSVRKKGAGLFPDRRPVWLVHTSRLHPDADTAVVAASENVEQRDVDVGIAREREAENRRLVVEDVVDP